MQTSNISRIIYLVIFAFLAFISFGVYYEDYEVIINGIISNQITPGFPLTQYHFFKHHVLLVPVYVEITKLFPSVNIVNVSYILILFASYSSLIKILENNRKSVLLLIFVLAILFVENIVFINYTKVAFVACAVGLLIILDSSKENSKFQYIVGVILFSIGILIRGESAIGTLIFILIYSVTLSKTRLKQIFKSFSFPFVTVVVLLVWINQVNKEHDTLVETDYVWEFEMFYNENLVDISKIDNPVDSMRYIALTEYGGDLATNNLEFMQSIMLVDHRDVSLLWNYRKKLNKALYFFKDYYLHNYFYFHFVAHLLFLSALLYLSNKRDYGRYLFFLACFHAFLFLTAFQLKMTDRIISSFYFMFNVSLLLEISKKTPQANKTKIQNTLLLGASLCLVLFTKVTSQEYKKAIQEVSIVAQDLKAQTHGKEVYSMTGESYNYLIVDLHLDVNKNPFKVSKIKDFERIDLSFNRSLSFSEHYRDYITSLCDCNHLSWNEYFTYLKANSDSKVFIMKPSDKDFLQDYLKIVHKLNVTFTLSEKQVNFPEETKDLRLYKLTEG